MKRLSNSIFFAGALALTSPLIFADTPPSLAGPHPHAAIVSGKINLFRSQFKGLEIGKGEQKLDSEVLVTIDTKPGLVFGVRLHEPDPAAQSMVDTLREAYLHKLPVTIEHRIEPGRPFVLINWVQYGETPK